MEGRSASGALFIAFEGVEGAEPPPLWIKPDRKLGVRDLMAMMRDHFEGTPLDMTRDVGAGPYALPYRWRPLTWEVDGVKYFNERAVSTQQTGFSFVAQARSWLPDPIGGVFWFGVDDSYSTVYVPLYCGMTEPPYNYAEGTGSFEEVTWFEAIPIGAAGRSGPGQDDQIGGSVVSIDDHLHGFAHGQLLIGFEQIPGQDSLCFAAEIDEHVVLLYGDDPPELDAGGVLLGLE